MWVRLSYQCLKDIREITKDDKKLIKKLEQKHQAVETINDSIRNYLVRISTKAITKADVERLAVMFDVNRSILKVAELTEEYVAQLKRQHDEDIRITEDAQRGMDKLFNHVAESFDKAIDMLDVYDKTKKDEIVERSRESFNIEHKLRKGHIKRLNRGECTTKGGLLYIDMIGVLERIGYHSRNVSEALVGLNDDVPTDEEIATTEI